VLRPGDVAVDAGANIGALAVPLARLVGPEGQVHAFEPQEHVFRHLVANAALNELDQLRCHHAAVGEAAGVIEVPRMSPNARHSFGSVALDEARRDAGADPSRGELVPVVAVDGLALRRCRLIKADVEGMEAAVLRGARRTIAEHRPLLYLEADQPQAVPQVLDVIRELGYRPYWHIAPYCKDGNHYGRPVEFFRGVVAVNLLAAPPGFAVNGLAAASSPDWRADLQAQAA
jgi:FkbM family methyltransferase